VAIGEEEQQKGSQAEIERPDDIAENADDLGRKLSLGVHDAGIGQVSGAEGSRGGAEADGKEDPADAILRPQGRDERADQGGRP
jgi:hypothetical protein